MDKRHGVSEVKAASPMLTSEALPVIGVPPPILKTAPSLAAFVVIVLIDCLYQDRLMQQWLQ